MTNEPNRAVLEIDDASGKRVCRLSLAEPYPKSHEIYLTVEFDDETEILIEVSCSPCFRITNLARDVHGELEPVKQSAHGCLRSLVKDCP